MKLSLITTRVKDAPVSSTARPTSSGGSSRAWMSDGIVNMGDGSPKTASLLAVTASTIKTYHLMVTIGYYDPSGAIPTGTSIDVTFEINTTSSPTRHTPNVSEPNYTYEFLNTDVQTSAISLRAVSSSSAVHSFESAGTHTFKFTLEDNSYGGTAYYTSTIIETEYDMWTEIEEEFGPFYIPPFGFFEPYPS